MGTDNKSMTAATHILKDLNGREDLGKKTKLARYLEETLDAERHEALRVAKIILMDKQQGFLDFGTAGELATLLAEKFGAEE